MEDLPSIIKRANRNKSGIGITCTVFSVRVNKREFRSALALMVAATVETYRKNGHYDRPSPQRAADTGSNIVAVLPSEAPLLKLSICFRGATLDRHENTTGVGALFVFLSLLFVISGGYQFSFSMLSDPPNFYALPASTRTAM